VVIFCGGRLILTIYIGLISYYSYMFIKVEVFKCLVFYIIRNFGSNGTSTNKRLEFAAEAGVWSRSLQHIQEPKLGAS
jgi:hypothetical protein